MSVEHAPSFVWFCFSVVLVHFFGDLPECLAWINALIMYFSDGFFFIQHEINLSEALSHLRGSRVVPLVLEGCGECDSIGSRYYQQPGGFSLHR